MSRIIVTGGAGFIGSHIVDALVSDGHEVHIIDNMCAGNTENINSKATFHNVDIRYFDKILPMFKDVEYVFHEAALPQVQYSMENPIDTNYVNVNGTLNVLEACRLNKVKRLIFASSSAVYGDQDKLPILEGSIEKPISPYGTHKYIGEVYCGLYSRIYGLETVALRYFNVYGPRQSHVGSYASVIARFIDLKKNSKPLTVVGDGNQLRSYVHVYDVVQANILAMKNQNVGHGEFMNIGAKEEHSVNQIAGMIGGDIVFIDPRVEPKVSSADIKKANELLGWAPRVEFDQGLIELKKYNNLD